MIWGKEQLPNQWKEEIICPMYKKGIDWMARITDL